MRNTIFLAAMVCLLAGCGEKGPSVMRLKTEANVTTSEHGLPVKIIAQDKEPLPIKIVPDQIAIGAFAASLVAVTVTSLAAIAASRAAYNTKKALEEIKKRSHE